MRITLSVPMVAAYLIAVGGCGRLYRTEEDRFVNLSAGEGYDRGLVLCLSGAGGALGEVGRFRQGLAEGDVQCAIESFEWSSGWMLGDQADLRANKEKAQMLARRIEQYQQEHPDCPVHLIGVSAGTGLIVWALEDLGPEHRVENVVLIASSLGSKYDLSGALKKVNGQLYSCYSTVDPVLAVLVPVTGTVDRNSSDSGGLHGFQPPDNSDGQARALYETKLSQIGWQPKDRAYGHDGGHLGGTQPSFVRQRIASLAWARRPNTPAPTGEDSALAIAVTGRN